MRIEATNEVTHFRLEIIDGERIEVREVALLNFPELWDVLNGGKLPKEDLEN